MCGEEQLKLPEWVWQDVVMWVGLIREEEELKVPGLA